MNKEIGGFIVGFFAGVLVMGVFFIVPPSTLHTAITLIQECETELPRNQHCKLKAVIAEEKEDE